MSQLRRARNRNRSNNVTYYVVIFLSLCVVLGFFYWGNTIKNKQISLDDDLCPEESRIKKYTAILFDISDSLTVTQREFLTKEIQYIKDKSSLHDRIAVFSVGDRLDGKIHPALSLCNPGTGDNIDELTGNPKMALAIWNQEFSERIEFLTRSYLEENEKPFSPLMESIQSISVTFMPRKNVSIVRKEIFIVSDMLQHTSEYSHYKNRPPIFNDFKGSPYELKVKTSLSNVELTIFYLRRFGQNKVQGKMHIEFWNEYFHSLGGNLKTVRHVDG